METMKETGRKGCVRWLGRRQMVIETDKGQLLYPAVSGRFFIRNWPSCVKYNQTLVRITSGIAVIEALIREARL
jgi:hypothetical protein